ncbi:MAG TPA: DUF305 domain-containing protein [Acidimicrobiales bacterium]|nr:DUF305 domain-containing protein [Acidimicrobiales bacterium]
MRSVPRGVVALLVAALVFLGGAVGYTLGKGRAPGESSADVRFLQDMILHHEQAVRIATTAVASAPDPSVQHFAREVVIFQQYEIGLMEGYLQRWDQPRVPDRDTVMEWMGHEVPAAEMPGLATDAALGDYERATGRDVDAGFLRMMTVHHRGGVHMAEAALRHVDDEFVRDMARRMATNQRTEIAEYQQLAQRLGIGLP